MLREENVLFTDNAPLKAAAQAQWEAAPWNKIVPFIDFISFPTIWEYKFLPPKEGEVVRMLVRDVERVWAQVEVRLAAFGVAGASTMVPNWVVLNRGYREVCFRCGEEGKMWGLVGEVLERMIKEGEEG